MNIELNDLTLSELKDRPMDELLLLAEDIRHIILSTCIKRGGHLGASLGAVELALALHRVFESPREPIIWDVGHQAYAHKLITGRASRFDSLRSFGGVSGFLSRDESVHDVFGAGHSSTSLSAALAIAWSKRLKPLEWTVAVIGDGGLGAGIAFEALNQIKSLELGPLLIVLNDNQMSISPNVGGLSQLLGEGRGSEYFSIFGIDYFGPVDGHDLNALIGVFQGVRQNSGGKPVLVHALTQKGKGYAPAEENPAVYHGIGPGPRAPKLEGATQVVTPKSFSSIFGEEICRQAEKNPAILAITAAMPEGTGLTEFSRKFPSRFFDVGIAEQHAVTFAAGLATQGLRPVCAIYSTFLQRAIDQIIHDVALQKLPVVFVVDRAGLVGADGPTHHGAFDLVYLRMIPGMTVLTPARESDFKLALESALSAHLPVAIRFPRGGPSAEELKYEEGNEAGSPIRWNRKKKETKILAIAVGSAERKLLSAIGKLETKDQNCVSLSTLLKVKPLPESLSLVIEEFRDLVCVVVEDGVETGGVSQEISQLYGKSFSKFVTIAYPDQFLTHGTVDEIEKSVGIDSASIAARIRSLLIPNPSGDQTQ